MKDKIEAFISFVRQPFQAVEKVEARVARIKNSDDRITQIEKKLYELDRRDQLIIEHIKLESRLQQAQNQQIRDELHAEIERNQNEISRLQREKKDIVRHSRKRGKTATGLFSTLTDGDAPPNLRRKH